MKTFISSIAAIVVAMADAAWAGTPGSSPGREHTTVARMTEPRLKAATEAVAKLVKKRKPVALTTGLTDYRAILHAHAEDSAHTGGTRPEMLEGAKRAGVEIVFLSDHFRPPRDFMDSWRGLKDGVLFIPGSETHGFVIHPEQSVMAFMDAEKDAIVEKVGAGNGMLFLSHVEARPDHPMDGVTGMEIYNRHADAMDDMIALFSVLPKMLAPESLAEFQRLLTTYHDAMFASQLDYPSLYLAKWDRETPHRRVVGIGANDCHHNQVVVAKVIDAESVRVGTIVDKNEDMRVMTADTYPGIRELTEGKNPGDIVAQLDFDPYHVAMTNLSTHILAAELTEPTVRKALKRGHAYVSHDWMGDPTGFLFAVTDGNKKPSGPDDLLGIMGDERSFEEGMTLVAESPLPCSFTLIRDGEIVAERKGRTFSHTPDAPGAYRLEAWLDIDDEDRIWIYSNPIYLR